MKLGGDKVLEVERLKYLGSVLQIRLVQESTSKTEVTIKKSKLYPKWLKTRNYFQNVCLLQLAPPYLFQKCQYKFKII